MSRPLRITYPGAYYHITSRGNERKNIFKSNRDREKFLEYLESAVLRYNAIIHVYCLMDNHYHLLLETPSGNLSQIMRHINGAYTTYFNTKRKRAGHLFQGRYKSILVDIDEYAKELSRYIHLNPVRAGVVEKPEQYEWSSYKSFAGDMKAPDWLYRDFILTYFGKKKKSAENGYKRFVEQLLNEECDSPLKNTFGSVILGSLDFINHVKDTYLSKLQENRDLPSLREFSNKVELVELFNEVDNVFKNKPKVSRNIKMYLGQKYSGKTLKEIAQFFEIGESGISQAARRMSDRIDKEKGLQGQVEKIIDKLNLSKM
ncbi:MAG: transposase [Desulfobacterales bacterium]|nr:transposase [Desulfobacterales bacterium]